MTKRQFLIRQANKTLRLKLDIERLFIKDLLKYFDEVKSFVSHGQAMFNSIHDVLTKHQNRIIGTLLNNKKKSIDKIKIYNNLKTVNLEYIKKNAQLIDETTLEKINASIEQAREELKKNGIENPDLNLIYKIAAKIFNNFKMGRVKNIAITNTNGMVEASKKEIIKTTAPMIEHALSQWDIDEIRELSEITETWRDYDLLNSMEKHEEKPDIETTNALFTTFRAHMKIWATMGDDRVRPTHEEADGQEQPIDQPFQVGAALLMEPGDVSFGYWPEEICNCRCSSLI